MMRLTLALSLTLMVACTGGTPNQIVAPEAGSRPDPIGIPDSAIGLAPGTAFEQPEQVAISFNQVDPGSSTAPARPNPEFPPVIPHSVEDLPPLTAQDNPCLECHDPAAADDIGAPAVPSSHTVDLRRAPDRPRGAVVGARLACQACHVAQTGSEPLVAMGGPR